MKKIEFAIGFFIIAISNATAKEWYQEEGTLYEKNMTAWCKASNANKLVTIGDFTVALQENHAFISEIDGQLAQSTTMGGYKVLSQEIVKGIDELCDGTVAIKGAENQLVKDSAILVMSFMQILKK